MKMHLIYCAGDLFDAGECTHGQPKDRALSSFHKIIARTHLNKQYVGFLGGRCV